MPPVGEGLWNSPAVMSGWVGGLDTCICYYAFNASFGHCYTPAPLVSTATESLSWSGLRSSEQPLDSKKWATHAIPSSPEFCHPLRAEGKLKWYSDVEVSARPCVPLEGVSPFISFYFYFFFYILPRAPPFLTFFLSPNFFTQSVQLVVPVFPWIQASNFGCGYWLFQGPALVTIYNLMGQEIACVMEKVRVIPRDRRGSSQLCSNYWWHATGDKPLVRASVSSPVG